MLRAHLVDGRAGDRSRCGTRLFAGGVLSGGWRRSPGGHGGAARRAARPSRPGQTAPGDRGVHPRRGAGSGAQIAEQVADRFGVRLHRRTIERARGSGEHPVVLAAGEAAQADYETLRAQLLEHGVLPDEPGRGTVRPSRAGRADRLARSASRCSPASSSARPGRRGTHTRIERVSALAAGYQFLLDQPPAGMPCLPVTMRGQR